MGSIAAIRLAQASQAPALSAVLGASAGRSLTNLQSLRLGSWLIAAAGDDAWLGQEGPLAAAVTGMIDDVGPGVEQAGAALKAVASGLGPAGMRGVFSAVVTDGERLWCWRDHLGFSPLFVATQPRMAVASTAGQALAAAGADRSPDVEMITKVFRGIRIADEDSYFRGVARIPKATLFTVRDGGTESKRYWAPDQLLESRRVNGDLRDEFVDLMSTAVKRALGAHPVVALSGGIDAPTVASLAAPIFRESTGYALPALSSIYPRWPSVDESRYIAIVADEKELELHTFEPLAGPLNDIHRLVAVAEAPAPTVSLAESDEFYRHAYDRGFRTILTGEMAEFVMAMGGNTLRHLLRKGRLVKAGKYLRAESARGLSTRHLLRQLASSAVNEAWLRHRRHRRGQLPQQQVSWLRWPRDREAIETPNDPWISQQLSAFIGPGLSVEADEAIQMGAGVRVRRPWLDVDLWEFFLSLPAEIKYPNGGYKALVRSWLRDIVPDPILDRRDRTYFEESFFGRLDYDAMTRLIFNGAFEMPGVDYAELRERLSTSSMTLIEAMWAKDLAVIHAFMEINQ